MELSPYLDTLRRELAAAAAPGGAEVARAAEMLGGSIEAPARLVLLEALSDAAAEITSKLGDASVDVRLRGREAQFVITRQEAAAGAGAQAAAAAAAAAAAEGDLARITLRLPDALKEAVERAAAIEGISVNTWLVRTIAVTVATPSGFPPGVPGPPGPPGPPGFPPPNFPPPNFPPGRRSGKRLTGYSEA